MGPFETQVESAFANPAPPGLVLEGLRETPWGLGTVWRCESLTEATVATGSQSGRLLVSPTTGWVLLDVPNDFVRGVFASLDEPDAVLPINQQFGQTELDAHISVMSKDEVEQAGGVNKIRAHDGRRFRYQLGALKMVNTPQSVEWKRAWYVTVKSPELEAFRKELGLTARPNNNKFEFHITVAGIRK